MSRNTFINTVLVFYERFRILLFNQILIDCILFQYVLWNFYFNEIDCLSEVEDTFWSPWPQVLENCPVLGSRTALFLIC